MSLAMWSALVGTLAALCTTLAFLPQLIKVWRHGGSGLSSTMLSMYLFGMSLWLVYGVLNDAVAVIAANVASIALVASVAAVKAARPGGTAAKDARVRIAIDMDEVMADALAEHVRRYNAAFGASVTVSDLAGRHLEQCVPPEHRAATEALIDESFFEDLEPFPECQEVVRELALRHEVYIATAAMEVPCSFNAKLRWLRRHFPFIPPSNIVYCGDKTIIDADYLIDDRARHFARFRGQPLLFSAPHNSRETRYPRVHSWAEVRDFFARRAPGAAPRAVSGPKPAREVALVQLPGAAHATRSTS
jgi:5'(3')-deoxyribonucleotidase/uncharacterized protein with PQ loop repeat